MLPEGVDEAEAEQIRSEASRRSLFDISKEAILARKYEAAAERAFLRCIKELRDREQAEQAEVKEVAAVDYEAKMASFLKMEESFNQEDEEFDDLCAEMGMPMPQRPSNFPHPSSVSRQGGPADRQGTRSLTRSGLSDSTLDDGSTGPSVEAARGRGGHPGHQDEPGSQRLANTIQPPARRPCASLGAAIRRERTASIGKTSSIRKPAARISLESSRQVKR